MTWLLIEKILTVLFGLLWLISLAGLIASIAKYHEYFVFSLVGLLLSSVVLAALNLDGWMQMTAIIILIILLIIIIWGMIFIVQYGKAMGGP